MLSVSLLANDFTQRIPIPLKFTVNSISWTTIGGPENAEITATGDWEPNGIIDLLRAPVEIYDESNEKVWYGFVSEIRASMGAIEVGVSMEEVHNRVAVAYTQRDARYTTSWAEDADSVAKYGHKEYLETLDNADASKAESFRDTILATYKWPMVVMRHTPNQKTRTVKLVCRGWFYTLGWRYYDSTGMIQKSHDDSDYPNWYLQSIGRWDVPAHTEERASAVAQHITVTNAQYIDQIGLHLWSYGPPWHDFSIELWSYAHPTSPTAGTKLAYGTVATPFTGTLYDWNYYDIRDTGGDRLYATASADYWLIATSPNPGGEYAGYWCLSCKREGGGTARYFGDDSICYDFATPTNMVWKIIGAQDTSTQLASVITDFNQFFGETIAAASGIVSQVPERSGDNTAAAAISELIDTGTSVNRRYLVDIMPGREVRARIENAKSISNATLLLDTDGKLHETTGELHAPWKNPCGQWCVVQGIPPPAISVTPNIDASIFLIERAVYRSAENVLTIEPRGIPSPFEVFNIKKG